MKEKAIVPENEDTEFRDHVLKTHGGEKIPTCMQCGICAGSCPVSHEMDYTPREIVRMIQLGLKEEILKCNTIWICTTCFSCSVRCPRGIRPTELMETLKPIAIAEGVNNDYSRFDKVFSEIIKKTGRASEFLLISKFSVSSFERIKESIKQAPFGLNLVKKGKFPLTIDKMEDNSELKAIFNIEEIDDKAGEKKNSGEPDKTEGAEE